MIFKYLNIKQFLSFQNHYLYSTFPKDSLLYSSLNIHHLIKILFFQYYIYFNLGNTFQHLMKPFVLRGHQRPINIVKFNYDGDIFFTGSAEKKVNMWESYTGERLGSFNTRSAIKYLDIDDNLTYLITASLDGTLEIFKAETGESIKWFKFDTKVKLFEFSLGDKTAIILQDKFKADEASTVQVFNFNSLLQANNTKQQDKTSSSIIPKSILKFEAKDQKGKNKLLTKIAWYINNKGFISSSNDGYLFRYDEKGQIKLSIQAHQCEIKSFALSKDFSIIATAAVNGCKIFDPQNFQLLKTFKQQLPMNTVAISPLFCSQKNPKYHLVMGGGIPARQAAMTAGSAGYQIHVCNIMYETELGSIAGHFGPVNSLDYFPDGRGFVSGGQEGISRVFRFDESYWDDPIYE